MGIIDKLRLVPIVLTGVVTLGCGDGAASPEGATSGTSGPPPSVDGIPEGERAFANFDGSTVCTLGRSFQPSTVEDAARVIRWAKHEGYVLRPISSSASHSENDVICPGEGQVHLSFAEMNRILEIDVATKQVTVEPAALMGDIGDALHEQGLGLPNTIPLRDLTAAGVIATGAHHTSGRFPSGIHDMVVRLELLDADGELVVLDGEQARGAATHLGLLGAVVSITFQAIDQFKLREGFELNDDADFENRVIAAAQAHDYTSISWFPSQNTWTMNYLDIVPVDTPGEAYSTNWISSPEEQELLATVFENINASPDGEQLMCEIEMVRLNQKGISRQDDSGLGDPESPVGYSHRMFSSSCEGLECPWNNGIQVFNPEVAIDLQDLPAWIGDIRALMEEKTVCFPVNGILLRFSKASDAWLSTNAGHDVAYVEWHIARNNDPTAHEKFAAEYDEIHQLTIGKYHGRPHWGKNYPLSFAAMDPSLYPRMDAFLALQQQMDPDRLFVNPFWNRVVGTVPLSNDDGCAISKQCICSEDRHCGEGKRCLPGLTDDTVRVCR